MMMQSIAPVCRIFTGKLMGYVNKVDCACDLEEGV